MTHLRTCEAVGFGSVLCATFAELLDGDRRLRHNRGRLQALGAVSLEGAGWFVACRLGQRRRLNQGLETVSDTGVIFAHHLRTAVSPEAKILLQSLCLFQV